MPTTRPVTMDSGVNPGTGGYPIVDVALDEKIVDRVVAVELRLLVELVKLEAGLEELCAVLVNGSTCASS